MLYYDLIKIFPVIFQKLPNIALFKNFDKNLFKKFSNFDNFMNKNFLYFFDIKKYMQIKN